MFIPFCCHSARRAFDRSCRIQLFYSRVNLPGEKVLDRADEGFGNAELSFPHTPSARVPLLPIEEAYFLYY